MWPRDTPSWEDVHAAWNTRCPTHEVQSRACCWCLTSHPPGRQSPRAVQAAQTPNAFWGQDTSSPNISKLTTLHDSENSSSCVSAPALYLNHSSLERHPSEVRWQPPGETRVPNEARAWPVPLANDFLLPSTSGLASAPPGCCKDSPVHSPLSGPLPPTCSGPKCQGRCSWHQVHTGKLSLGHRATPTGYRDQLQWNTTVVTVGKNRPQCVDE